MQRISRLLEVVHQNSIQITLSILALFAPIQGIMLTVGLCIFADTAFGIWKAKKLGEEICSRKLSRIISKMFLYQGTIMLFFLIDKFILGDILGQFFSVEYLLTKVIALVLASVEIFSIDENMRSVKGTGLWEAFKNLTSRAKDISTQIKGISDNKPKEENDAL